MGARRRDAGRSWACCRASARRYVASLFADLRTRPCRRVHHVSRAFTTAGCTADRRRRSFSYAWGERLDHDRARRAPHGARRPRRSALCTAAMARSSGYARDAALTFLAPLMASAALRFARPSISRYCTGVHGRVRRARRLDPAWTRQALFRTLPGAGRHRRTDSQTGFTAGIPQFLDGIDVVLVVVGLFAVGETVYGVESIRRGFRAHPWIRLDVTTRLGPLVETVAARHADRISPRGAARRGAEIPTFLSYVVTRLTKLPEEFGRGAIEGVAGPEAANNASAAGTLVPLLTLALPTSATAAVMLAAFPQVRPSARADALPA